MDRILKESFAESLTLTFNWKLNQKKKRTDTEKKILRLFFY